MADEREAPEQLSEAASATDGGPPQADEAVFESWLDGMRGVIDRGLEELNVQFRRFLDDLTEQRPDLHIEQEVESLRSKQLRRILTKARRRGVLDPDRLLDQCHEPPDAESATYPVGDLLGLRVVVRSLRDVEIIKQAALDRGNIGDPDRLSVDDLNEAPRPSGYRALHLDGTVTFDKSGDSYTLPFEVQVKTLAQHVFGQHTHEDAYVRDEINTDPRFEIVRGLQRAMAESLNAVDLTEAEIEVLAARVRDEIAQNPPGEEITYESVLSIAKTTHGVVLRTAEARAISKRARAIGLETSDELSAAIDPDGPTGRAAIQELQSLVGGSSSAGRQIQEALRHVELAREAQRQAAVAGGEVDDDAPDETDGGQGT